MFEIIAMLSMLSDHFIKSILPAYTKINLFGRIALPLYTYGIVQGFIFTRNVKKYVLRLFFLAVISQFFFSELFQSGQLNIIFTYIAVLFFIVLSDKIKLNLLMSLVLFLLFVIAMTIMRLEAGFYTLILALIYLKNKNIILRHFLLNIVIVLMFQDSTGILQQFSLIGSFIIFYMKNSILKGGFRNFYRIFYPLHLGILWMIKTVIN